jgi:hypothetical protein
MESSFARTIQAPAPVPVPAVTWERQRDIPRLKAEAVGARTDPRPRKARVGVQN